MPIKSDKYGFLIGEGADSRFPQTFAQWEQIGRDTRLIRLFLERSRKDCEAREKKRERSVAGGGGRKSAPSQKKAVSPAVDSAIAATVRANLPASQKKLNEEATKTLSAIRKHVVAGDGSPNESVTGNASKGRNVNWQKAVVAQGNIPPNQARWTRLKGESDNSSRDNKGRFTGEKSSFITDAIRAASDRISASSGDVDRIDPAIAATREVSAPVKAIAAPLIGSIESLSGRKKDKQNIPWFKKIWREMRYSRRDDNNWNRKQLKAIEEVKEGQQGGSWWMLLLAGIGGLLAKFLNPARWLGLFGKMLPAMLARRLPGVFMPNGRRGGTVGIPDPRRQQRRHSRGGIRGWLGGLFERGRDAVGGARRGIGGLGGRIGRVRGLGALGALLGLVGVASTEMDSGLSRLQKNQQHGSMIAGMAPGALGAVIGGVLLGPVGAIIGGLAADFFLGDAASELGEKIGTWFTNADIGGKFDAATSYIKTQWDAVSSGIIQMWNNAVLTFSDAWDSVKSWVNGNVLEPITDFLNLAASKFEELTGIDPKKISKAVTNGVSAAGAAAKQTASNALDYVAGYREASSDGSVLSKVLDASGRDRKYETSTGATELRQGGTLSWRNNNPGNIRKGAYANSMGAIGDDGAFAIFPTYEAGAKAKENLIFGSKNYKDLDLKSAIARYAPPNENDTGWYQKTILDAVGGANKRMSDYTAQEREAILKAMEKVEGFKVGRTQVKDGTGGLLGDLTAGANRMFGQDKALPADVLAMRVKASDGSTRTLSELGVSTYGELQARGGQAFAGGQNDAETTYATAMIQKSLGNNFDRLTAQNDLYHSQNAPGSEHTKGNKTDFTVKGISSDEASKRVNDLLSQYGLVAGRDYALLDEYKNPSAKATGGHMDFRLNDSGKAKISAFMESGAVPAVAKSNAYAPYADRPSARAFELMSKPEHEHMLGGDDYALAKSAVLWTARNAPDSEKAGIAKKYGAFLSQDERNALLKTSKTAVAARPAVSAPVPPPKAASVPPVPPPPSVSVEAPKPPSQNTSASASAQVRLPNQVEKAGRDVSVRAIAHIVAPIARV